jgi:uncharacterized protein YjcR
VSRGDVTRQFYVREVWNTGCGCHPELQEIEVEGFDLDTFARQVAKEMVDRRHEIDLDAVRVVRNLTLVERDRIAAVIVEETERIKEQMAKRARDVERAKKIEDAQRRVAALESRLAQERPELNEAGIARRVAEIEEAKQEHARLRAIPLEGP